MYFILFPVFFGGVLADLVERHHTEILNLNSLSAQAFNEQNQQLAVFSASTRTDKPRTTTANGTVVLLQPSPLQEVSGLKSRIPRLLTNTPLLRLLEKPIPPTPRKELSSLIFDRNKTLAFSQGEPPQRLKRLHVERQQSVTLDAKVRNLHASNVDFVASDHEPLTGAVNSAGRLSRGAQFREAFGQSSLITYEPGDISAYWASQLRPVTVHHFHGTWRLVLSKSDSVDAILSALNIPAFKRHIMAIYEGHTEINVARDGSSVYMRNFLPAGKIVAGHVPLSGQPFQYHDSDTGVWTSRAQFTANRLVQIRQNSLGTMYDVRVVFPTDPDKRLNVPFLLFKWTFISAESGLSTSANRWLRLTTSPALFNT